MVHLCLFFLTFTFGTALADPLADQFNVSTAPTGDRDFRSGVTSGMSCYEQLDAEFCTSTSFSDGFRFGEADHPGPRPLQQLVVGCTNPGGLRRKETLAVEQGPGIWTYAETQLSAVTQPSCNRALKAAARTQDRHLRTFFSAPAALRSRSTWAGTWTGVACTSDFSSQLLQISWPSELWQSGRVLATLHHVGNHTLTVVSLYGFPRGPTWPGAASLMNEVLEFLSQTFIFGHSGLVLICGDFNFGPQELGHFNIWRQEGWHTAQELAALRWGWEWQPTCKGATERDLIWMSPAVSSLCTGISIEDVFADHASISVTLSISEAPATFLTWPRPQEITWEEVDISQWHEHCNTCTFDAPEDATEFLTKFSEHFENSLTGYVGQSGVGLSHKQRGRASRLKPMKQTMAPQTCKASRHGEVVLQHDLVGTAVLRWFKQLRRLQSYKHSITAGNRHYAAEMYRIELWNAIRRAHGFDPNFASWWERQDFYQALGPLPTHPPEADLAVLIFEAFHHEFRVFERWHLGQKTQLVLNKYTKSMDAIFRELRDPKPDQIDNLWTSKEYTVKAVRPSSKAALLDAEIVPMDRPRWSFNGCGLTVDGHEEEMIVFSVWPDLQVGHTLTQSTHTRSDDEVHQKLFELWQPRWQQMHEVDPSTWDRIVGFVQNFMPSFSFSLPDITPEQWLRTVRRFKPTAARGADGYAKKDLLYMSPVHISWLLQFLTDIENGRQDWPQQMLEGLVLALAKHSDAHTAGSFRPIVLFSMIFRCWGSLRSRQILKLLEACMHSDAFGFIPGREAAQSWLQLQGSVELALQSGQALSGMAVDFIKAFNNIRRPQWFTLATHIGLPQRILRPWQQFLKGFTRRFQINNHLSSALTSDVGFAEGDPLSVPAMATLDWALHVYQAQFAPLSRTLSYVDNIAIVSHLVANMLWAFFSLLSFLDFWGLEIDVAKSYVWSTTPAGRAALAPLGLQLVGDVSELGGSLTFGSATRVRIFLARGARLERKWARLKISKAPLSQKLASLPMVFWSAALHGALGCVFADSHLHHLRKKAVAALGIRNGGANALLRLSLAEPTTADPGYYHVRHCIFDFRRLCSKTPDILVQWRCYMKRYDGHKLPGPFYKVIELFSTMGWSLQEPPCFYDHDGFQHNLMQLSNAALERLLQDGWLQFITSQVRHRKTMHDLQGINHALTFLDRSTLTPLELGRLMALQSGAFLSDWNHAKFDKSKEPICPQCLVPNTQRHWFRCPAFAALREEVPDPFDWLDGAPDCLVYHLLVPRSSFDYEVKHYFQHLGDTTNQFHSLPGEGTQHLFSDGSMFADYPPILNRGSWSLVNATTGHVLGFGHLPGLVQSIARSELTGVIAACDGHASIRCILSSGVIPHPRLNDFKLFLMANGSSSACKLKIMTSGSWWLNFLLSFHRTRFRCDGPHRT